MCTLIPAVYQVQLPSNVAAILEVFRVGIELDAWNIHFNCYGMGGIYWQIVFLMVWPVVAIACTPLIGLVLALIFKQTTIGDMARIGWRGRGEKSPHGAVDCCRRGRTRPLAAHVVDSTPCCAWDDVSRVCNRVRLALIDSA